MRLLVTGASGFVGRNVVLSAPRAWEVAAAYHRATDFPAFLAAQGRADVRAVSCDLRDAEDVRRLRATVGWKPDVALYLAAHSDPSHSVVDPLGDLESNACAVVNFLEHCPSQHLIYCSSGAVYSGLSGPVSPATPVNPQLPYAISKLAAERYVRFFAERRGAPQTYTILRFFGAYGPYEPARKITTRWLAAVANRQRAFTLRGDGKNLIALMYIDDTVDALLRLINAPGPSMTADLAADVRLSLDELVAVMARVTGVSIEISQSEISQSETSTCSKETHPRISGHAEEGTAGDSASNARSHNTPRPGAGCVMRVRHEGDTAEYIRFHSTDSTLRDRYGWSPAISFDEGLRRLQAFLSIHSASRNVLKGVNS